MNLIGRIQIIERKVLRDPRGALLKAMRGDEEHLLAGFGEIYVTWAQPGQSRGGHFHPLADEWFTLLDGTCRLVLVDPDDGERAELMLSSDAPCTVRVPAGVAHRLDNRSIDRVFLLLAYANRAYDPADTVRFDCGA